MKSTLLIEQEARYWIDARAGVRNIALFKQGSAGAIKGATFSRSSISPELELGVLASGSGTAESAG